MAKRRLSNFNFESEGSHIALVHANQGGPANGVDYALITKATKDISTKDVEKATMVQVEMTITDFLCKFFGLWYDDAEVLAKIMGYDTEDESYEEAVDWWEEYIQERVDAVTIMKSLVIDKSDEEISKAVASLKPKELLSILEIQKDFEQKLSSQEGVLALKNASTPSVENSNNKGTEMTEFVSKAAYEAAIEKAVQEAVKEKEEQLTKALQEVETYKSEKAEAVAKSRKTAIASVEKDETEAEELFKSLNELSDEAFERVIKNLQKQAEKLEQSDLFKETGNKGQEVVPEKPEGKNLTAELLKKQFQKGE